MRSVRQFRQTAKSFAISDFVGSGLWGGGSRAGELGAGEGLGVWKKPEDATTVEGTNGGARAPPRAPDRLNGPAPAPPPPQKALLEFDSDTIWRPVELRAVAQARWCRPRFADPLLSVEQATVIPHPMKLTSAWERDTTTPVMLRPQISVREDFLLRVIDGVLNTGNTILGKPLVAHRVRSREEVEGLASPYNPPLNPAEAWRYYKDALVAKCAHDDFELSALFDSILSRRLELPYDTPEAVDLWRIFMAFAARDRNFSDTLVEYAHWLCDREAPVWPAFYDIIMESQTTPDDFLSMHSRLYERFRPHDGDWGRFLATMLEKKGLEFLDAIRRIYESAPGPTASFYHPLVTYLCSKNEYAEAMFWHDRFRVCDDLPQDGTAHSQLLRWATTHHSHHHLYRLLQDVFITEKDAIMIMNDHAKPNTAMFLLFNTKSIPRSIFRDEFWAFLLSNPSRISPTSTIEYLFRYGANCIVGHSTLLCASKILRISITATLEEFRSHNITVEDLPHAIKRTKVDIATKRLASTLCSPLLKPRATLSALSPFLNKSLPLNPTLITLLPSALLRPRQPSRAPDRTINPCLLAPSKDLDTTIAVHLQLLSSGHPIPATTWTELLKRLGKTKQWRKLIETLDCLVTAYPPHITESNGVSTVVEKHHRRPTNPAHRALFTSALNRALVEWGVQHAPASDHAWGVRLLRKLVDRGVWVDERSVKRAARVGVRTLGEKKASEVLIGIEEAWGSELWADGELHLGEDQVPSEEWTARGKRKIVEMVRRRGEDLRGSYWTKALEENVEEEEEVRGIDFGVIKYWFGTEGGTWVCEDDRWWAIQDDEGVMLTRRQSLSRKNRQHQSPQEQHSSPKKPSPQPRQITNPPKQIYKPRYLPLAIRRLLRNPSHKSQNPTFLTSFDSPPPDLTPPAPPAPEDPHSRSFPWPAHSFAFLKTHKYSWYRKKRIREMVWNWMPAARKHSMLKIWRERKKKWRGDGIVKDLKEKRWRWWRWWKRRKTWMKKRRRTPNMNWGKKPIKATGRRRSVW